MRFCPHRSLYATSAVRQTRTLARLKDRPGWPICPPRRSIEMRKMRVAAWLSLLFLLAAAEAPAAKWVSIADGSARAVYLDSEALQRDGTTVHAWTREVYMDEQRSPHVGVLY